MFTKLFSIRYISVLFVGLLCFTSCQKGETDTTVYSAISVYNGVPTATTYDVYLDGTRVNGAALPIGGSLPYAQQVAGDHTLSFTIAGRGEVAYTKQVSMPGQSSSSFFLVGKPNAFDSFIVSDDLSATSSTTAFVRFVNVSPDAPAVDLFSKTTSFATSQAYKTASKFVAIDAGAHTFDVKQNGTAITSSSSVTLTAGFKYTVLLRGMVTPTASDDVALGVQVIQVK